MNALAIMTICAAGADGLLAGVSFDTSLVKLPARLRIGARAYAAFARGADLGNGILVYALLGVGAAALTVAAAVLALLHGGGTATVPLSLAGIASLAHTFTTTRAAPRMLSIRRAPDDESQLAAILHQFARWQAARATLQVATFFLMLWALVALK
ncbi:MAG TPA: hypothetical protein VMV68_06865 [Spirochaetia bacterium]|nr:hypothetical protein [Spirochaetia bacterium]